MDLKRSICFSLLVFFSLSAILTTAQPMPGSVFRDYQWFPERNYHVLSLDQKPFLIPGKVDLTFATKAEVVIHLGNTHLNFDKASIQLNNGEWFPIQFPANMPDTPSAASYFYTWYPSIAVPLTVLKNGAVNSFQLKISDKLFDGTSVPWHKPWSCVYGVTLRVYYEPAKKNHITGVLISPTSNATIADNPVISCKTKSSNTSVSSIDYIGCYEDVNVHGDGQYRQWQYTIERGVVKNHIGTDKDVNSTVIWKSEWVPNQIQPIEIAALIKDETGLVYFTESVKGITLKHGNYDIELCKPYDVPPGFTQCQYGTGIKARGGQSQKFFVKGEKRKIVDAEIYIPCWNGAESHGFLLNDNILEGLDLEDTGNAFNIYRKQLNPITALLEGNNIITTLPQTRRGTDIILPGIMVKVKYQNTPTPFKSSTPSSRRKPFVNSIGLRLVHIDSGTFIIGSPDTLDVHDGFDEIQHKVKLTKSFMLSETEITQAQWSLIMGTKPSYFKGDNLPVENISYYEAQAFCKKLSEKENKKYRLPTEAEWEYSCRARTTSPFYTGNTVHSDEANFKGNMPYHSNVPEANRKTTMDVATFPSNPWGLFDMIGNVWEWCSDWYSGSNKNPVVDPTGPVDDATKLDSIKVVRGGAWDTQPKYSHAAFRFRLPPGSRYNFVGFRVVLEE